MLGPECYERPWTRGKTPIKSNKTQNVTSLRKNWIRRRRVNFQIRSTAVLNINNIYQLIVVLHIKPLCLCCCDIFQTLTQTIERIPTISTQLKIVATVKATMIGADGNFIFFVCMSCHAWRWNDTVLCFRRDFPNLKWDLQCGFVFYFQGLFNFSKRHLWFWTMISRSLKHT